MSLTAFTAAIALLYRLALSSTSGADYAWRAILLLAAFPYAVFTRRLYTESLFLPLSVATFYAMRRRRLTMVALAGPAAGLTPSQWLLVIAVPLALLAMGSLDSPAGGLPLTV